VYSKSVVFPSDMLGNGNVILHLNVAPLSSDWICLLTEEIVVEGNPLVPESVVFAARAVLPLLHVKIGIMFPV